MTREDHIIDYVLGHLEEKKCRELEEAISADPSLQSDVDAYRQVVDLMESDVPEVPTTAIRTRFDHYLAKEIRQQEKTSKPGKLMQISWRLVAMAASFLLLGIWVGQRYIPGADTSGTSPVAVTSAPSTLETMASLVNSPRSSYRIRGVNLAYSLAVLDDELRQTLETVLFTDKSANVRLAAAEALAAFAEDSKVRDILLRAVVEVDEPIVRISLIGYLTGIRESRATTEFENLLIQDELPKAVRDELHAGLIKLM